MRLVISNSYERSARLVADEIAKVVQDNSRALLGLATGSSPLAVYDYMLQDMQAGRIDYSAVQVMNLDEYVGLSPEHEQSYVYFMRQHLFNAAGVKPDQVIIPDGLADPVTEVKRLNDLAAERTIDLQLLGIGSNGHVGFNEPQEVFHYGYHLVELTEQTRADNARMFSCPDDVPTQAITMGVGDIMKARTVILIATGENKREALKAMLEQGEITPQRQCSVLKFHHDCRVFIDRKLAQGIVPGRHVEVLVD